jgi:RNA polymerase sigma factor (sigma-70 family)
MATTVSSARAHRALATPGFLTRVSALVHTHRERLLSYARRRGLDAEEALDAVQDSFISFLGLPEAPSIAHGSVDSLKLLTVILRHNIQNRRRKQQRRSATLMSSGSEHLENLSGEMENSETLILHAEELARVNGCILRMARLERDVVMFSLLDEEPSDRVAEILGISAGYVRVLIHRAREHIRTCSLPANDHSSEPVGVS